MVREIVPLLRHALEQEGRQRYNSNISTGANVRSCGQARTALNVVRQAQKKRCPRIAAVGQGLRLWREGAA